MGLGLLGGALNDVKFLAQAGAILTVTDLKSAKELKPTLDKLKKYSHIKYVLGRHRLVDFQTADFILQPGNVPLDSIYLAEARKNNIPIHVSESLFFLAAGDRIKTIGVTGTRGKSTTTKLIYDILSAANFPVRLAGNVKGVSTLALLSKVKPGDWVVLELDSWSLAGLRNVKVSPNIAVFTNFMRDHQNFYRNNLDLYFADKAEIFLHQQPDDFLICSPGVWRLIKQKKKKPAAQVIVSTGQELPHSWRINLIGEHNRLNIAYAIAAATAAGVSKNVIKKVVENYRGVEGRLQLVKIYKKIKIYNDTTATTPEGGMAGIAACADKKSPKVILIAGGADKDLDYHQYAKFLTGKIKVLILLPGAATNKIFPLLPAKPKYNVIITASLVEAVDCALAKAVAGDTILFSPGAASFGLFANEFDRGEQFEKIIKKLK